MSAQTILRPPGSFGALEIALALLVPELEHPSKSYFGLGGRKDFFTQEEVIDIFNTRGRLYHQSNAKPEDCSPLLVISCGTIS